MLSAMNRILAVALCALSTLLVTLHAFADDIYTLPTAKLSKNSTLTWCRANEATHSIPFLLTNAVDNDRIGSKIVGNFYSIAVWSGGATGFCSPEVHASSSKWYADATGYSTVSAELWDDSSNPATDDPVVDVELANEVAGFALTGLTVSSGATQTNVVVPDSWASVKNAAQNAVVRLYLTPDLNAPSIERVVWTGGTAGSNALTRLVPKATATKTNVMATSGAASLDLDVWVIWSDLQIRTSGTIDAGNNAIFLEAGNWPDELGGGKALGTMTCEGTSLTYAYTVGKIEAKAVLQPAGIEDVILLTAWGMRRTRTARSWDDGAKTTDDKDVDDTKTAVYDDKFPESGGSVREIYNLDAPGCSATLEGTDVNHTAETYSNFDQWAVVNLGDPSGPSRCSDIMPWSYQARVNVDKPTGKVELNSLGTAHITIPTVAHYPPH